MMLSNPSQLVLRNADRLTSQRLLLINPPSDNLLAQLPCQQIKAFSQDYQDHCYHQRFQSDQTAVQFGARLDGSRPFNQIVIFASKEKALTEFNIAMAASRLTSSGSIWLIGENKAGIKSCAKLLNKRLGDVHKLDSARHCTGFVATTVNDADFNCLDWLSFRATAIDGQSLDIATLPGVFSSGRLDAGTALLLGHLPSDLSGRGLDFGCGSGVISAFLLAQPHVASMDLVDVNAMALAAAQATLSHNQLSGRVIAGDSLAATANGYDFIISNPPFHRGISTDYAATEQLIRQAGDHLRPDGQLVIVANAFLDYPRLLKERFAQVDTLVKTPQYRVCRCRAAAQ